MGRTTSFGSIVLLDWLKMTETVLRARYRESEHCVSKTQSKSNRICSSYLLKLCRKGKCHKMS